MTENKAKLPPRWVIRRFWFAHRRLFQLTGGRVGPWQPGGKPMHAGAATGEEHERLWAKWAAVDDGLDGYAALRSRPTTVVVFEPRVITTAAT